MYQPSPSVLLNMPHSAMQAPPIPSETRPDSLMPQSLLSLPSLKQYMVHRLVHEGTSITTMEAALSHYASHYHTMAQVCSGARPHEQFPRQDCYLTPHDKEVIHRAYSKIPVERLNAMNDQLYRAQQQRCLQLYVQEAQAWSKSIEDKIAQMKQKGEKIEDHEADDHQDEGLQQLAQLEYIAFRVTQEFLEGGNEKPIRPSNVLEALQLTPKLVDDQSFDPAYTKKQATRLYQICYRNYSRGYVRVGTEKMLYMADKCFWHQFWPDEEFPRENAHIFVDNKDGIAMEENKNIAGQVKQGIKQADTRNQQNEVSEVALQHNISNSDKPVKTTNFREGSRPKQNAGILTMQRRKEHRRKLKQDLSSKKQAAEALARVLSNHTSKASILSEHPQISQEGSKKAQSASLTTQLQSELSVAGVAATTAHKDSKPLEDSRHSSEVAQDLQLNPSSNRLQTLDEMIEGEKEIASQLRSLRASCPSPEKNRKICQGGDALGAADGGIKEASNDSRFCVIL
ncbi:hypothetical protein BPAE_0002g00780 [Botrytis paeoniae]|uniref:Uncharacterized protein n=1 Tax=Botrytis paeoniae TaxID=278948 RepID=A0A4Z1G1T4_9HELO|nr:hypothetical protein BPAE_0002g00780 [Botrytis paeoniae]